MRYLSYAECITLVYTFQSFAYATPFKVLLTPHPYKRHLANARGKKKTSSRTVGNGCQTVASNFTLTQHHPHNPKLKPEPWGTPCKIIFIFRVTLLRTLTPTSLDQIRLNHLKMDCLWLHCLCSTCDLCFPFFGPCFFPTPTIITDVTASFPSQFVALLHARSICYRLVFFCSDFCSGGLASNHLY